MKKSLKWEKAPMSDTMMEAMRMAKRGLESYGGGGSSYGRRVNKMK